METTCRLSPVVFKRNGVKIEEKDSILFQDIKKAVQDRETAWEMWAYTKTSDFKNSHKDLDYDENGEVTFSSFMKAMNFDEEFNKQKDAEDLSKQYGFTNQVFDNVETAIEKVNDFNSKEDKYISILEKTDNGYKINVIQRTPANIQNAKEQSFNHALSKQILRMLQSMGFNVEFSTNPKFDGLFDPENATLFDGLINIISIAKGELGEAALPEEFAHLIIEGLISHPLVQRLLSSLDNPQIKNILGDNYNKYYEEYNGDIVKLKKEAAGKLLAQYITGRGTIEASDVTTRKPLLSRIWNWAKSLFSKITGKDIQNLRQNADNAVASIYNLIATKEVIPLIDKPKILKGEKMYALKEEYDTLEKVAYKAESIQAKMLQSLKRREALFKDITETSKNVEGIQKLNKEDRFSEAIQSFLGNAEVQLTKIRNSMLEAKRDEERGWNKEIKIIAKAAKVARDIDEFVLGYSEIIDTIASFPALSDAELGKLGVVNHDVANSLAEGANRLRNIMNTLTTWRQGTSRNIVLNIGRTVIKNDIVVGVGSKRDEIMSLEQIVEHADRDIIFVDRWFSALSDADDTYLVMFDGIVKNQQYERDLIMQEYYAKMATADAELRKAGFSSDFIYEKTRDGIPNGRLLSIYDFDSYNEELKNKKEQLRKEQEKFGRPDEWYRSKLGQWVDGYVNGIPRRIKVYTDPKDQEEYERTKNSDNLKNSQHFDWVPNPAIYSKNINRIKNLSPAQQKYYDEMMKIKREMMLKIPHRGQGLYKAIYISKDFVEGVLDNSSGNIVKAVSDHYKRKFVRRPDDIGFGTGEDFTNLIKDILSSEKSSEEAAKKIIHALDDATGEDILTYIHPKKISSIIDKFDRMVNSKELTKEEALNKKLEAIVERLASENFYTVETDFANHRIQRLPIYYTRPLKREKDGSMPMLSTDFTSSMIAYAAMAVNYEKMNEVVDILEIARDYANEERTVREKDGSRSIISKHKAFGKLYKSFVERAGNGTNIAGRLNDYMNSVVYEERKNNEGTMDILGVNLDVAKTLDTIKDYTGLLGLGFNLFSTVSNIAVGKLQQWIEAAAGEYFTVKDYANAVKQYSADILGCIAEMNSPIKKNKLSLLIQMFDPMGDYFEGFRDSNYNKNPVARILGNGALAYIGMNAGEHLLHCQTMLAILNNIKLINTKTNEKISLYDALEVKEENGITKLQLQDDLAYERELVDNSGTPESNKNYGRPVKDENGKIKVEQVKIKNSVKPDDQEAFKNYRQFIIKKKKVIRKVNDSLNGAFNVNDKGAIHKMALGRLVIQFRQWMPAHYMRRFARAHYDADLEQWREGYYLTVVRTINQIRKECKRAGWECLKIGDQLSEHEKANLRRATAEISEFLTLLWLVKLGGRVKDRDRSWLDKMALYQIRRMYLEVGASMPLNGEFFDNIFTLLQSPSASINTFEKFSKILQWWNMFDEVQTGRFQGWSEWERDAFNMVPALGQITKAMAFDDSMFSMFERND